MDLSKTPTYHAGIAQSKAHRVLRALMAKLLAKHDLTMMQWFILGVIYDADKKGLRITDLADYVDTTMAFITNHVNLLESKGLVTKTVDPKDTRVRIVKIEPKAKSKVHKIEEDLRVEMRQTLYSTIKTSDLATYVRVLEQIASIKV